MEVKIVKQQIEVIEKKRLRQLLSDEEVEMVRNGKIALMNSIGKKLGLDDDVDMGTIIQLSPLQGG